MEFGHIKPVNKLWELLVDPTDKLKKEDVTGLVYCIRCRTGWWHVGDSDRGINAQFGEHQRHSSVTQQVEMTQQILIQSPGCQVDLNESPSM